MKVKTLGFGLGLVKGISVADFYQQMERFEDKEIKIYSRTKVVYVNIVDGYICGLVLSYKTNKKSLVTTRDESGDLAVRKDVLKKGENGTEISIFVINPETLRGAFYSYSGGVSASSLKEILKVFHDEELKRKKKNYINEITEFGAKKIDKVSLKVARMFPGAFDLKILSTPSDISQILERYSKIKTVTIRAENALSDGGLYTPLDDIANKSSIVLDVDKESKISEIRSRISSVFKKLLEGKEETALRVIGNGMSGEELSLQVGENNDSFGQIEYDEFVDQLPLVKWKNYQYCKAMLNLINKVDENSVVFGSQPCMKAEWTYASVKPIYESSKRPQSVEVA